MLSPNLINGSSFSDERGKLKFFNTFNMKEIVRFYEIALTSIDVIRGWQGHQYEKKWFYCHSGEFVVNLVKIDNFDNPSDHLIPERFVLDAKNPFVLEVPEGYGTGFKANRGNSKLLVFSNFTLDESKQDDFRYSVDKWSANW